MKNNKKAYPNYIDYFNISNPRNISKWTKAFKDIYIQTNHGLDKTKAFDQATSGWDPMEKKDFENWMKFYQGGNHEKYKTAQLSYYVNDGMPGYVLPFKPENKSEPVEQENFVSKKQIEEERKELIESQRSKFISRLNSAEKLLMEEAGHLLAGNELNKFLEVLHSLKRQILSINKKTRANKTYIDLIIRNANILHNNGFNKSALLLEKLAQNTATPEDASIPSTTPPPVPKEDLSKPSPTTSESAPSEPPLDNNKPNKLQGFLQNLDPVEKGKSNSADDGVLEINDFNNFIVEAQEAPQPNATPIQSKEKSNNDLEITEDSIKPSGEQSEGKDFDYLIDIAFKNLKVEDVIRKLEEISKIFKTREISRQLAIADVMLDRLGLASFFPTLAEATNKSLESNQYCLSRIEDVLSALRGTLKVNDLDLTNENEVSSDPKLEIIKQKLENDKNQEKERKQLRKNVENKELMEKTKKSPEIEEVANELQKPIKVEEQSSVPPAPIAPKK